MHDPSPTDIGRTCGAAVAALICVALLTGCSPQSYRESADREVHSIINQKTPAVPHMLEQFSIEQTREDPLESCPTVEMTAETPEPGQEERAVVLSLEEALEIAARHSRDYQTQKENLFLSALALTLERYRFAFKPSATAEATYDNTDMGDDEQVGLDTGIGYTRLFATGARLSVDLLTTLTRFLTHDPREAANSILDLTITQPLLRGAGIVVTEPLVQAERDVIYAMREFVRFRRQFFVGVLSDYYGVLRERQVLENERLNYENLVFARDRAEALGEAGQLPEFQVDQTRQQVLRAEDQVENAQQRYQSRLDRFKITLGLPTDTRMELDPAELDRLGAAGSIELPWPAADGAVSLALEHRLDLATAQDRRDDAERKVRVARNDLLPGLDLSAGLTTDTDGGTHPIDFDGNRTDIGVGLELDLPLDRRSERNQYRRRLIDLQQRERNFCETRDQVVLGVRDAWRQYNRARNSYQIQKESVALAERRVDSTSMLLEAGRAETRDMLEAREALVSAQNALATALVEFRVARLALARDMGILQVSRTGQLKESFDKYK